MIDPNIALGALVILLSLALGALFSRWYFAPAAAHRALLRPQAAEVNDIGWCPAEQQERLHAFHPDNSRTCWTCRTHTPGGAA